MSDQTITAISGIIAAAIAALGGGWWGRRKGAADAAEGQARAEVMLSGEARAIAADLRADLDREQARRERLETALDTERERCAKVASDLADARAVMAGQQREIDGLRKDMAALRQLLRQHGITPPGETPPHGTPAAGGGS